MHRPLMTSGFDCQLQTRIVYGENTVDRLGEHVDALKAKRVLLVTDPGLVEAGHCQRVVDILNGAGKVVRTYDRVRENPTTLDVAACLDVAREAEPEVIVALGGGSSLDTAKGCNFLFTNGGRMEDYWGVGLATKPMLPLIAVPTTAGTGSEVQSFALISREEDHAKMACGDPMATPRMAILDPTLTVSLPRYVTAVTGLDTVAHAVETAVCKKRNGVSSLFSREAFRLARFNLPRVLADPVDLDARGKMLQAAAFAGVAIENSMLGAAHSLANPLTAHYDVVHGQAVGMMLPGVVRFNAEDDAAATEYANLAVVAGLSGPQDSRETAVSALIECLRGLLREAELPTTLKGCGVPLDEVKTLAVEAAQQWTAQFNPRVVDERALESLYRTAS